MSFSQSPRSAASPPCTSPMVETSPGTLPGHLRARSRQYYLPALLKSPAAVPPARIQDADPFLVDADVNALDLATARFYELQQAYKALEHDDNHLRAVHDEANTALTAKLAKLASARSDLTVAQKASDDQAATLQAEEAQLHAGLVQLRSRISAIEERIRYWGKERDQASGRACAVEQLLRNANRLASRREAALQQARSSFIKTKLMAAALQEPLGVLLETMKAGVRALNADVEVRGDFESPDQIETASEGSAVPPKLIQHPTERGVQGLAIGITRHVACPIESRGSSSLPPKAPRYKKLPTQSTTTMAEPSTTANDLERLEPLPHALDANSSANNYVSAAEYLRAIAMLQEERAAQQQLLEQYLALHRDQTINTAVMEELRARSASIRREVIVKTADNLRCFLLREQKLRDLHQHLREVGERRESELLHLTSELNELSRSYTELVAISTFLLLLGPRHHLKIPEPAWAGHSQVRRRAPAAFDFKGILDDTQTAQILFRVVHPGFSDPTLLPHGITVATNGDGPRVALIVTDGFRGTLAMWRSQVPGGLISRNSPSRLQDSASSAPLSTSHNGAPGRIGIGKKGVEAITVSFIKTLANNAHESSPEFPISLSSSILPALFNLNPHYHRRVLHGVTESASDKDANCASPLWAWTTVAAVGTLPHLKGYSTSTPADPPGRARFFVRDRALQASVHRTQLQPPILYRTVCELDNAEAHTAYGARVPVPGDVHLLIAGMSCVYYSNLNNQKQGIDANGESGQTFRGMLGCPSSSLRTSVLLPGTASKRSPSRLATAPPPNVSTPSNTILPTRGRLSTSLLSTPSGRMSLRSGSTSSTSTLSKTQEYADNIVLLAGNGRLPTTPGRHLNARLRDCRVVEGLDALKRKRKVAVKATAPKRATRPTLTSGSIPVSAGYSRASSHLAVVVLLLPGRSPSITGAQLCCAQDHLSVLGLAFRCRQRCGGPFDRDHKASPRANVSLEWLRSSERTSTSRPRLKPIVLPAAERAIHIELEHHLLALDKRGRKSESDREKRVAKSLGDSKTADLLKRCSHCDLDAENENATKACDVIVEERQAQLDACKEELLKDIIEGVARERALSAAPEQSIFSVWVRTSRETGVDDADATEIIRKIIEKADGKKSAEDELPKKLRDAIWAHREATHEIKRLSKELVGRVRSLRFITAVRDLQKERKEDCSLIRVVDDFGDWCSPAGWMLARLRERRHAARATIAGMMVFLFLASSATCQIPDLNTNNPAASVPNHGTSITALGATVDTTEYLRVVYLLRREQAAYRLHKAQHQAVLQQHDADVAALSELRRDLRSVNNKLDRTNFHTLHHIRAQDSIILRLRNTIRNLTVEHEVKVAELESRLNEVVPSTQSGEGNVPS
uniref:Up-regulated during septation protein 1 domain-containing protein n=1 Tax=Mycena chlorophos TaxID=658473 RepID=A0ABQ0KWY4_MYCCL|nr:predicted protein [Mycena chlorophos]